MNQHAILPVFQNLFNSARTTRDCVAIRHEVRIGIQPREAGNQTTSLDYFRIARLGGNDGLEEIHENSYSQRGKRKKN